MISDLQDLQLYNQVIESYGHAFVPGTVQNKLSQAKLYVSFMPALNRNVWYPQPEDLMMYSQLLFNSLKSTHAI